MPAPISSLSFLLTVLHRPSSRCSVRWEVLSMRISADSCLEYVSHYHRFPVVPNDSRGNQPSDRCSYPTARAQIRQCWMDNQNAIKFASQLTITFSIHHNQDQFAWRDSAQTTVWTKWTKWWKPQMRDLNNCAPCDLGQCHLLHTWFDCSSALNKHLSYPSLSVIVSLMGSLLLLRQLSHAMSL